MTQQIKQFYNCIGFPGKYTIKQLLQYGNPIQNPYLRTIESQIDSNQTILDAGCGTGLTTNLFSIRHPTCKFVGVDFSDSVDWAESFGKQHSIDNAKFIKQDLTNIEVDELFDIVICQGVLHHIPEYETVLCTLKQLVKPGGKLILGLYHPAGKIVKKFFDIDYKSSILFQDQELNPFEISFTFGQIRRLTQEFDFKQAYPQLLNNFTIPALFNYKNGGLITYIFEKHPS
jgi:ubiquinone/menaquinone biosynthesis C-methylase UbiE